MSGILNTSEISDRLELSIYSTKAMMGRYFVHSARRSALRIERRGVEREQSLRMFVKELQKSVGF
jgi:hypothetical protein